MRTSLVIDPPNGRVPPLTPAAQKRAEERRAYLKEHPADGPEDRSASDRCIVGFNAGPPLTPGGYNQNMQVVQTKDHVVLVTEMVHTARIVPLDGRPRLNDAIRNWSGEARGHWEGDTLVIETTNFNGARLARVHRQHEVDRTPDAPRCRDARVQVHGDRSGYVDQPVDRGDPAAPRGCAVVRVRLPRGQSQHAGHPLRPACRGQRGRQPSGSRSRVQLSPRGCRPSDSPTRSLARRCVGALRSRGSLTRSLAAFCLSGRCRCRQLSRMAGQSQLQGRK